MDNTQPKPIILKGITIALVITILIYTSFYLLMNWDYHLQTMRGRFLGYGQLSFFIGIWFIHTCYCCIYEFIPDTKKERANYGFLVIPFIGIISIFLPENYSIKFILGFSIFSLPCTILIRNISDRIYTKVEQSKYFPIVLTWKYIYLFWIINYIVLNHISYNNPWTGYNIIGVPRFQGIKWETTYWWILGMVTLLITLYHLYSNHWKDGILMSLLMVFWGLFTCNLN